MLKKTLPLLLCLIPVVLFAQHEKAVETIFMTGFGSYMPDPAGEKVVGQPVPDFRLETSDGQVFTPESLRGKVVVLDFWATWCGWCKRMSQDIEEVLAEKYRDCEVVILGVTYKENDPEGALRYWTESGYSFPMTLDNNEPGASLKAGHPSVVVVGPDGVVRGYFSGWSASRANEIDLLVSYLLGDVQMSRTAAREAANAGEYMKALLITDVLMAEDPQAEKSLWQTRLDLLEGMESPYTAGYIQYLRERYAGEPAVMAALEDRNYTGPLVIRNVNIVDVISGRVIPYQNIFVFNGRIVDISQMAGMGLKAEILDGNGAYVVPGLMDAHIHVANGYGGKKESAYPYLEYFLRHGITSVRDAGGDASILGQLKREIDAGEIPGPDLYYSAYMAGPEFMWRGGPADSTQLKPWHQCLAPGSDLDAAMEAAAGCGATGVKLYAAFSPEFLAEVTAAAKRHGLKTWSHAATFSAKPHEAVEAGVEVPSHVYLLQWENVEEPLSNDILASHYKYLNTIDRWNIDVTRFCEAMKKHGAILDATLCVSYENEGDWIMKCLRDVYEQGVKIAAGTDCVDMLGKEYPFLFDELDYFVNKCGFSTIDALRSATIIAAETVGAEDRIGSVEVGKKADLLIVDGNPLENINNLKNRVAVIKDGEIVK